MLAPWQETFADARDGDGEGGGPFGISLGPFCNHLKTILRPPMPLNYVFHQNINYLGMAHSNFVSSIRITPYQPSIEIKIRFCGISNHSSIFSSKKQEMYFQVCAYIQQVALNLIKILKTKLIIQNTPKTPK